jgi:hypothetical protein
MNFCSQLYIIIYIMKHKHLFSIENKNLQTETVQKHPNMLS